jgi:hypothetical protein
MPRAKAKKKVYRSKIYKTAKIGRFDGELKTVSFKAGDTVKALAERADLTIHEGEEINDEKGNTVAITDLAKERDYFLTGNFSNGN